MHLIHTRPCIAQRQAIPTLAYSHIEVRLCRAIEFEIDFVILLKGLMGMFAHCHKFAEEIVLSEPFTL